MEQHLTLQQLNNLRIGNSLAAEIPASMSGHRAFVVIGAYVPTENPKWGRKPPKALNSPDQANLHFWLRRYEVEQRYLEHDWDIAEPDLHRQVQRRGIASIEDLERELETHLHDFSLLDVSWRRDNPV